MVKQKKKKKKYSIIGFIKFQHFKSLKQKVE